MALPKQHRLGSSREFTRVYRRGARAATEHLAVRALRPNTRPQLPSKPVLKGAPKPACSPELKKMMPADESLPSAASFGISISRKVSKRAVVRNRIKRQIKSIIRQYLPNISPGWQVVIVVRPAAVECEFDDFLRELEKIFRKLKILNLK